MKKTRVFLGVATLCIALVGVAAAKSNSKFLTYDYYTVENGCQSGGITTCDNSGSIVCTATVGGNAATFYQETDGTCVNELNKKAIK